MRQGSRQEAKYDPASSEFDGIVKLDNDGGVIEAKAVFRGLLQCSPSKEITLTFPTAAQLIAASPKIPCAGFTKRFSIRNDGRSGITLVAGEGGVIDGDISVPANPRACHYVLRFVNVISGVEAYQIIVE